jgi:two-component sensor histidine kinase
MIQRKTGVGLSILLALTAILNFINGIINFQETITESITNIAFLYTAVCSILLLITGIITTRIIRFFQTTIIFIAGFSTIMLTVPDSLTGELILLFGMALAYQYGYFASLFYTKILSIMGIYILTIFTSVILVNELKLPFGIPSILFSFTTIYLFWIVFREEINIYLIRTNQLSIKLDQTASENIKLGIITADQAVLIEEKNRILEENLKEKTEIEKELLRTLKVKEVLLQEVHHRVKNNLTVINSLFNLQRSDDNSDAINDFIEKNSNRLYAMAAVHESVYQNEGYESVNLADYFSDIIRNLVEIHSQNEEIKADIQADEIEVAIDIAVPLGIILNDCVSNSIAYGFGNEIKDKVISIIIREKENIEIIISDNGIRFLTYGKEGDQAVSFSIWLIKLLVEDQLQGSIETGYDHGNIWTIQFPHTKSKSIAF